VTKDMNQVKEVIICGRSIPESLKDAILGESDNLQRISLLFIAVTQRSVVTQTLPVGYCKSPRGGVNR